MKEIRYSQVGKRDEFPRLNFIALPFTPTKLDSDNVALVCHAPAEFDLCVMTARESWKYKDRKRRLALRGIVLREVKGQVGSW